MDLAESVDDLICTFEGNPDLTMDTLAMFIFGWLLAALFILWLGKLIYAKFILKGEQSKPSDIIVKAPAPAPVKATPPGAGSETPDGEEAVTPTSGEKVIVKRSSSGGVRSSGGGGGGYVPPTPPTRKRLSRKSPVPDLKRVQYTPAPQATGPDNVSVLWVNDVFQWLYNDLVIVNEILNVWIQTLNENTQTAVSEVRILFIYFNFYQLFLVFDFFVHRNVNKK